MILSRGKSHNLIGDGNLWFVITYANCYVGSLLILLIMQLIVIVYIAKCFVLGAPLALSINGKLSSRVTVHWVVVLTLYFPQVLRIVARGSSRSVSDSVVPACSSEVLFWEKGFCSPLVSSFWVWVYVINECCNCKYWGMATSSWHIVLSFWFYKDILPLKACDIWVCKCGLFAYEWYG